MQAECLQLLDTSSQLFGQRSFAAAEQAVMRAQALVEVIMLHQPDDDEQHQSMQQGGCFKTSCKHVSKAYCRIHLNLQVVLNSLSRCCTHVSSHACAWHAYVVTLCTTAVSSVGCVSWWALQTSTLARHHSLYTICHD